MVSNKVLYQTDTKYHKRLFMTIGILTFHTAHNYGAVLQCFALQEYIKSLGHKVYIIDYRPKYITNTYKKHSWRNWICSKPMIELKKLTFEPFLFHIRSKRYNNFVDFIQNYLNLYPYNIGMNYSEFDAIIVGSDQIWEAAITGGQFDKEFFGINAVCKVFSYAASNKSTFLNKKEISFYQTHLQNFIGIGVRENTLKKLLEPIVNKNIYLNIDPTLLAGDILKNIISNKRLHKKRYVVVYEIIEHKEVFWNAKKYAKDINADIVILNADIRYDHLKYRNQTASPVDFFNYIRNAECVFTTSFHGTAISILCKTNFYCFKQHTSSDTRSQSLLETIGLSDRFIEMGAELSYNDIDYKKNEKLNHFIHQSKKYINDCITISI